MRALIIGSGGREHAVVKSLSESSHVTKIFASPGNAGTSTLAENVVLDLKNHQSVVQFCQIQKMGFVFIGPEDPLVDGLADSLREANILVVGPSKNAALLEGSKISSSEPETLIPFLLKAIAKLCMALPPIAIKCTFMKF